MSYGNDTYPASRRMYSRPYPCYFQHLYSKDIDKEISEFRDALHDIGEDLLGKPFYWDLNVDRPFEDFSPAFWNENRVTELTDAKDLMKAGLPEEAGRALDNIVDHIAQAKIVAPVPNGPENHLRRQTPYDLPFLAANFKILWQHDIMLDPRITFAEQRFFEGSGRLDDFHHHGEARLLSSLEWMAQPENAKRIGLMFLYSRLAQHYSEVNPKSYTFARRVAEDINIFGAEAVIAKLQSRPRTYYKEFTDQDRSLYEIFLDAIQKVKPAFPGSRKEPDQSAITERNDNTGGLINATALVASAKSIVSDYQRLADGSWARAEMAKVLKIPAVLAQPALTLVSNGPQ